MLSGSQGAKSPSKLRHRESVRPGRALVDDFAVPSDQVETIRPSGVSSLRGVRDSVEHGRNPYTQLPDARGSDVLPLIIGSRGCQHDAVFNIGAKLPKVGRMGLLNIDDVKGDPIPILVV